MRSVGLRLGDLGAAGGRGPGRGRAGAPRAPAQLGGAVFEFPTMPRRSVAGSVPGARRTKVPESESD
ncbi:MAG: hypothetical protein OXC06_02965 [Acidimicrobiaceae bacterium]|nr:hypothetical protein [Acidimicrobiaceae bacterium]